MPRAIPGSNDALRICFLYCRRRDDCNQLKDLLLLLSSLHINLKYQYRKEGISDQSLSVQPAGGVV